jgi:REP element-mobilizing transposase RayT
MARKLRYLPHENATFEVVSRAIHGRLLLRPSEKTNSLIRGILGRALFLYPVRLHVFSFVSNHFHLIVTTPDFVTLSSFMCFVCGNIARRVGKHLGWREKFWGRRFSATHIDDDLSLRRRVRYVLSHGSKENLVLSPRDWPGPSCIGALTRGERLFGVWHEEEREYDSRRSGSGREHAREYEIGLAPLPGWEELSEGERRARFSRIVGDIERETERRLRREKKTVLGVRRVLEQSPFAIPAECKKGPAPACHARSVRAVREYVEGYREFVARYREASARLVAGGSKGPVYFPEHCFPPGLPYTPDGVVMMSG